MVEEYDSIVRNSVWDVVPRPENKSVVSSCWNYKVKQAAGGSVEKHKERFVSRVFSQVERSMFLQYILIEEQIILFLLRGSVEIWQHEYSNLICP